LIIGKVGLEIGFHRYFTHKSFKTSKIIERLLLILGSLNMLGSSLSWCGTHRLHHAKSDTDKDPHTPISRNVFKVWFIIWPKFNINLRYVSDMIKDPWHVFIHQNYFVLCLSVILLLGMIDYKLLIFGIIIPIILEFHVAAFLINIVCHKWGSRNYETNDNSKNNILVNSITGGSGLHNNHHAKPNLYYFNHNENEFDFYGKFIKWFLIKE